MGELGVALTGCPLSSLCCRGARFEVLDNHKSDPVGHSWASYVVPADNLAGIEARRHSPLLLAGGHMHLVGWSMQLVCILK